MNKAIYQSVQHLFEELEGFLVSASKKLERWKDDAVNNEPSFTLGMMMNNLTETVANVKCRTHQQTLEEWTNGFRERHDSMGMVVTFNELGEKIALPCVVQNELACVMQEACSNAVKHGKAGMIQILVIYQDEGLKITIADNGIGMSESITSKNGKGIGNMRSRVEKFNGAVQWLDKPDSSGTVVVIDIPSIKGLSDDFSESNVKLGHELHDILCPEIIGVTMMLANMKRHLSEEEAKKWYELKVTEEKLSEYASMIRELSHQIM